MNEKYIIAFDPAIASFNYGDRIISSSAKYHLRSVFNEKMIFDFATHIPNFDLWQKTKRNGRYKAVKNAQYKFICGSNIISNSMLRPWPNFNLNLLNKKEYRGAILMAAGSTGASIMNADAYTKYLFKSTFSKDYYHSTRDEITKQFLESIGFKAINTGCVTMWNLTPQHCSQIATSKSDDVVFTLSNEVANSQQDRAFINVLKSNYKNVYFSPQGMGDINYFNSLNIDKIQVIAPDIQCMSEFYSQKQVDYVGTRLHGGIFAIQHKKRAVILAVDNRAMDIHKTYNINCIERSDCKLIENKINSDFETTIKLDLDAINQWKSQF